MRDMNKIIVILGQTSTGKSDFAVQIAREIKGLNQSNRLIARTSQGEVLGEIISADSRQVYKGMNLGTGKITKKEMKGVPHYLLDIVSPNKIFSVVDFQKKSNREIKKIIKNKKVPIICGGTGFYIDSIINGNTFPKVKTDKRLREELSKKSVAELFEILKKLDKDRAENIDKNNKVRLIRAIEIAKSIGGVPKINKGENNFEVIKIGLKMPDEILKEKIKNRLIDRIKKGMIKEVLNLHKKEKISWRRLEALGLEYRYTSYFLQGKMSKDEMIEKLFTEIWHFAKRQWTWFKRDKDIIWINPLELHEQALALKKIKDFLRN